MNTGIVAWSVVIAIVYAMLSKHQASYDQIIEKYSGLSIKSSMAGGIEIEAYHIFNLECKYEGKTIKTLHLNRFTNEAFLQRKCMRDTACWYSICSHWQDICQSIHSEYAKILLIRIFCLK